MKRYTLGSSSTGELEKKYVNEVLDRNFISPGPVVAEVEKKCAEMHNMRFCTTINSGQAAIEVGLRALAIKHKDRFNRNWSNSKPLALVPASTYISTLSAAVLAGYDIMLVDVELETGNMCPNDLERRVTKLKNEQGRKPDVVVPVHLYGKACSHKIRDICRDHSLLVLEDAAESTCAPYIGWGDILITSFFSNHLISGGGGGAIMTNDEELDLLCWKLTNHGREQRYSNDDIHRIADKFRFDMWAHSGKWNDVSAAIVKAQLERKEELYQARKDNAGVLLNKLQSLAEDGTLTLPNPDGHCFMMFPILVNGVSIDVNDIIKRLNDNNIEIRRMMPITNQTVVVQEFAHMNLIDEYPRATCINHNGFYVGCHPELSPSDMEEMGDIIVDVFQEVMNDKS